MTQIVNRRVANQVDLGTLGDNVGIGLDTVMNTLTHKAFLFEYRARGHVAPDTFGEFFRQGGVQIVLSRQGVSAADIDTILTGAQITDVSEHTDVPIRQQVFAIGDIKWEQADLASPFSAIGVFDLMFKPKSKGGILFQEGSGWTLQAVNRGGAALTGGAIGSTNIYERFAYEGGS